MGSLNISQFVRRQVPESRFSHWTQSDVALLTLVETHWAYRKPGYRDGVCLVPVPPEGFFTSVVTLKAGDRLKGGFEPRVPGEEPRKYTVLDAPLGAAAKQPAVGVDIVLYRKDVLDEDGDWKNDFRMLIGCEDGEWAVISVNARPTEEEMPIEPGALMANHFHFSGGTATGMTAEEFVAGLGKSLRYWRDKTHVG